MRGPYGFEMNDNCQTCKIRKDGFFCQLEGAALKMFDTTKASSVYPEGAVLFIERQEARGVFVLCEGQVKLSISSSEGKTLILHIAKPGEVLGLTAVVGGTPYEVTAETLRPCQVAFIRRDDFLRFVGQHPEVYQNIVKQMAIVTQRRVRATSQRWSFRIGAGAAGEAVAGLVHWHRADARPDRTSLCRLRMKRSASSSAALAKR